jgi:hypothetical protein
MSKKIHLLTRVVGFCLVKRNVAFLHKRRQEFATKIDPIIDYQLKSTPLGRSCQKLITGSNTRDGIEKFPPPMATQPIPITTNTNCRSGAGGVGGF